MQNNIKLQGHGFFRKTKVGLASGLVLGAAALTLGTGASVSADEVTTPTTPTTEVATTGNPATNLVEAQPEAPQANVDMAGQAGSQTGALTSEVTSQELNTAVDNAKNAGVDVKTGESVSHDTIGKANQDLVNQKSAVEKATADAKANAAAIAAAEAKNAEIAAHNKAEADRVAKENAAGKVAVDAENAERKSEYDAAKSNYDKLTSLVSEVNSAVDSTKSEVPNSVVDEENIDYSNMKNAEDAINAVKNENSKAYEVYKAEKARVDAENARVRAEEAAFASSKIAEGNNGVVVSGKFNHGMTGKDFYKDITVTYTGNDKSVKLVKEIGWSSSTSITDVNGMNLSSYSDGTPNGVTITSSVQGQYVLSNVSVGDSFKLNNIGKLADGTNLNALVTVSTVQKDNSDNSYFTIGYQDFGTSYNPIAVDYYNFARIGLNFKLIDDSGNEVKTLQAFIIGDVDFAQGSVIKFKDNTLNYINPEGSELIDSPYGLQTSQVFESDSLSSAPLGTYLATGLSSEVEYIHTTDIDKNGVPETNNKNYFIEFLLFGTAAQVDTKTFVYESDPSLSLTKVSAPESPKEPSQVPFIPVSPTLKPHVEVPDVKTIQTEVHPVFVKQTPANVKDVVNEDGLSVNGKLVPKGSTQTWELKNATIQAGREEVTAYVMDDPAPADFLVDMNATKEKNAGAWVVTMDEDGKLQFVATDLTLGVLNANRAQAVNVPVAYFVGSPQNDGGTYQNTFTTVVKTPKGEYKVVSNTPVIYTPGNDPENPRETPTGENPTPDDNLIHPKKDVIDSSTGRSINGQSVLPNSELNYVLTQNFDQYKGMEASNASIAKNFLYIEDYLDAALDGKSMTVQSIKAANGDDVTQLLEMYHVLSQDAIDEKLQAIIQESGISPVGEFYMWVAKDPQEFYKAYVQKGLDITYNLSFKIKETFKEGDITNATYQIDFGNGYYSNIVVNNLPKMEVHKDVLDKEGGKSINNGTVAHGQEATYQLEGWVVPANRGYDLFEYKFVDQLQNTHDMFLRDSVVAKVDIKLADGTVIKKGSDLSQYTEVKYNEETGLYELAFKEDFLKQIPRDSEFGADVFLVVKRIAAGKVENQYTLYVNGNPVKSEIVRTVTPEPEKPAVPAEPVTPETPKGAATKTLPNTGTEASVMSLVGALMAGLIPIGAFITKYKHIE